MSSRLFQEIREKRGLCYTIFSQLAAYSDIGLLTIYTGTSERSISSISDIILDELKRVSEDLMVKEVDRARAQMKAGLLMGLESSSSRAERLARLVSIWGVVPNLADTIEKIDNVSVDNVKAFSESLISNKRLAVTAYGPVRKSKDYNEILDRMN
jgi:predicted Zn-dependent peptidase